MSVSKFFGASVQSANFNVGFNEQGSNVQIELVEDIANGDSFVSGVIGAPYSFVMGTGLRFDGLLRGQTYNKSPQGFTHSVILTSPNEILDGLKVVLAGYNGSTNNITNVFNVYGFWEDANGFGGSLINEAGMIWKAPYINISGNPILGSGVTVTSGTPYGIMPGIEMIQSGINPNYGSGIFYKGNRYRIDFSNFNDAPTYYRPAVGYATSALQLIDSYCKDAGSDYTVNLVYDSGTNPWHTIQINRVNRSTQAPLGKIAEYIAQQTGIISVQFGQELMNNETSIFLVGGDKETLMLQTDSSKIYPFWGLDSNTGQPIIGAGFDDNYTVDLDSTVIYDIIGSLTYTATIGEMRFALSSQDMWAGYIQYYNPTLAELIGIPAGFSVTDGPVGGLFTPQFAHDFIDQSVQTATTLGRAMQFDDISAKFNRVYQFVVNYAQEYYGRKFLVETPYFVFPKVEPETNRIFYNWEPTNSAFLDNGLTPLGLDPFYQELVMDFEDKYTPFIRIDNVTSGDLTSLTTSNYIIQDNSVYIPCRFINEYGIMYNGVYGAGPSVVAIELESPLYSLASDGIGGYDAINSLFNTDITDAISLRNAALNGRLHPAAFQPTAAALPFRSNQFTYGPWYRKGADGKVEYQQDTSLVPWQYGGYLMLDNAANSKISQYAVNAQVEEMGSVVQVGYPNRNLGDVLMSGGPIITNINVSNGAQGITTSYTMRTYTPRAAAFTRDNADRFRRLNAAARETRRSLKQLFRAQTIRRNFLASQNYKFMQNSLAGVNGNPYGVMMAMMGLDENGNDIPLVSAQTHQDSVGNVRADDSAVFQSIAAVSKEGIYRGFTTALSGIYRMPHFESPSGVGLGAITNTNLNPLQPEHDFQWFAWGDNYSGLHPAKTIPDLAKARLVGMRAPMVKVGWGYTMNNRPVPNASGDGHLQDYSGDFISGVYKRSSFWKAGASDERWDTHRKLWASPGIIYKGTSEKIISSGSSGILLIEANNRKTGDKLDVFNYMGADIGSGVKMQCGFDALDARWTIISADCS